MAEMPWSKFFWSDWESDQGLRLCSLAAQGLWMRMLCVCARHEPKGYLSINGNPLKVDAIARLAGVAETEAETLVAELELNGVFSRNRAGCIYSRRMVKDEKRSQEGRKHKKRGLQEASEKQKENPEPSRVPSREPSPQKPEARYQKKKREPVGSPKKAGSRLPDDWRLPKPWGDWAVGRGLPEAVTRLEAEKFSNYWRARPGREAAKLDWELTWRNWVIKAISDRGGSPSPTAEQLPFADPSQEAKRREIDAKWEALKRRNDAEAEAERQGLIQQYANLKAAVGA